MTKYLTATFDYNKGLVLGQIFATSEEAQSWFQDVSLNWKETVFYGVPGLKATTNDPFINYHIFELVENTSPDSLSTLKN